MTSHTQPALLAVEVAIHQVLQVELVWNASYFAGNCLGEYSALVAAGALEFLAALKIVRQRGILMENANAYGGMAALIYDNIESTDYRELLVQTPVEVANINSKNQVVISGPKLEVEKLQESFQQSLPDLNFVMLNVRTPFHSTFMQSIQAEFKDFLQSFAKDFTLSKSKQVFSNYTGKLHEPDQLLENLVQQLAGAVQWVANMEGLLHLNCQEIYEIGPNRVLSRFFSTLEGASQVTIKSIINLRSAKLA